MIPHLRSQVLALPGIAHGFFGRAGGVSQHEFASLNCSFAAADDPAHIKENRTRVARVLGASSLSTANQIHSAEAIFISAPFGAERPSLDGLVTATKNMAVGALAADCMTVLFADPVSRQVAAAHAGWRGALAGILERTITVMAENGARPDNIRAAFGPCLRQPNFEVGLDLVQQFTDRYPGTAAFFAPGLAPDKRQFDLVGFGRWRLEEAGLAAEFIDDVGHCTLGEPEQWFSYRHAGRRGQKDYGRHVAAIALTEG